MNYGTITGNYARNKVTSVINERKYIHFNNVHRLYRNDLKKMWSEIKRLVPGKNKHRHITCDISANYLNLHLANIGNKMNFKFQTLDGDLFCNDPKSIHTFRVTPIYKEDGDINDEIIYVQYLL